MTSIHCISSLALTQLIEWKNRQFNSLDEQNQNIWCKIAKETALVSISAVGVTFVLYAAIIETIAFTALSLLSLALSPFTRCALNFSSRLLQSSRFTIIWSISTLAMIGNTPPFNPTESAYRLEADILISQYFNKPSIYFFRNEDFSQVVDDPFWSRLYQLARRRAQGADFIETHILRGADRATQERFNAVDPTIIMFVLTKSIYIYSFGERKDEELPLFFLTSTNDGIRDLRNIYSEALLDPQVANAVANAFTSPEQFEIEPEEETAKKIFRELKIVAAGELRAEFIKACWPRAQSANNSEGHFA